MAEAMPPRDEMLAAFTGRDGGYDGLFVAAVRTTGIFCRSSCPARKPDPRNVEFFATAGTALAAGYRPCLRCRPLDPGGAAPAWLCTLLADLERDPRRRCTDADLAAAGLRPEAVRRWFRRRFGMTFHGYARARRLAAAVGNLQQGAPVADAAFDHGYESLSGFSDAIRHLIGASPGAAAGSRLLALAPVDTPLGLVMLGAAGGKLCLAEFADPERLAAQLRQPGTQPSAISAGSAASSTGTRSYHGSAPQALVSHRSARCPVSPKPVTSVAAVTRLPRDPARPG